MHGLGPYITLIAIHTMIAGVNFGLAMAYSKMPSYDGSVLFQVILGMVFLFVGVPYHIRGLQTKLAKILKKEVKE